MPGLPQTLSTTQVAVLAVTLTTLVLSFRLVAHPVTDWTDSMAGRYGVPGTLLALASVGVAAWVLVGTVATALAVFDPVPWRPDEGYTLAALTVPLALWGTGQVLRSERAENGPRF